MQNKKAEKQFFDEFVINNTNYDVFDKNGYKVLTNKFKELIAPKKGQILLDLGGGTGAFGNKLNQFDLNINIVDISFNSVKIANKLNNSIQADIEQLPFKENSVDIVCYSGVLHHFENFRKVLQEGYRVLKSGGKIFAYEPHYYNPFMWLYRAKNSPFSSIKGRTNNERLLTELELFFELFNAGFLNKNIYINPVSGITYKYIDSKVISKLLFLYNFQERLFKYTGLENELGSFLIVCAEK